MCSSFGRGPPNWFKIPTLNTDYFDGSPYLQIRSAHHNHYLPTAPIQPTYYGTHDSLWLLCTCNKTKLALKGPRDEMDLKNRPKAVSNNSALHRTGVSRSMGSNEWKQNTAKMLEQISVTRWAGMNVCLTHHMRTWLFWKAKSPQLCWPKNFSWQILRHSKAFHLKNSRQMMSSSTI